MSAWNASCSSWGRATERPSVLLTTSNGIVWATKAIASSSTPSILFEWKRRGRWERIKVFWVGRGGAQYDPALLNEVANQATGVLWKPQKYIPPLDLFCWSPHFSMNSSDAHTHTVSHTFFHAGFLGSLAAPPGNYSLPLGPYFSREKLPKQNRPKG